MELSNVQKLGIALSAIGGVILLGVKWLGFPTILVGALLVVVGLFLALRNNSKIDETPFTHDNTGTED